MPDDIRIPEKMFHAVIQKHWDGVGAKQNDGDDGRLYIEGYASTSSIDRWGEVVVAEKEVWDAATKAYMTNPILLFGHNYSAPVGGVVEMRIDEGVGFWIKAFISKTAPTLIEQIKERIVRAFSIGFRLIADEVKEEIRYIKELELYEVSVVAVPANREALFNISKAFQFGNDLVIRERDLTREIENILTQKIKALGLDPAESITANQVKGIKVPDIPAYEHLTRLLASIRDEETTAEYDRFKRVINNE